MKPLCSWLVSPSTRVRPIQKSPSSMLLPAPVEEVHSSWRREEEKRRCSCACFCLSCCHAHTYIQVQVQVFYLSGEQNNTRLDWALKFLRQDNASTCHTHTHQHTCSRCSMCFCSARLSMLSSDPPSISHACRASRNATRLVTSRK